MELHVAFLRGMNLGGRRIKNEELRAEFERLGFSGVAAFRASGNVIFDSGGGEEAALTRAIEAGLGEALGYAVPVFLRSATGVADSHIPAGWYGFTLGPPIVFTSNPLLDKTRSLINSAGIR